MKLVRVVPATKFQLAGFSMRFAVWKAFRHFIPLVQLVEEYKATLILHNRIINPDFVFRHKFIDVIMTSSGEVDIKDASYESTIYDPYIDAILQPLPEIFMNGMPIRQLLAMVGYFGYITCAATFFTFDEISLNQGPIVWGALAHQIMLHEKMIYKKYALIMLSLLIDPELFFRDIWVSEMLSEVRKFLINMAADETAVNNPDLDVPARVILANVNRFQVLFHIAPLYFQ
jgi:hypothetical protein